MGGNRRPLYGRTLYLQCPPTPRDAVYNALNYSKNIKLVKASVSAPPSPTGIIRCQ